MKQIIKILCISGIALSLFGCSDDDKIVDSGAIADSICKTMVQCEGKLGKLPGTLTAADVQNKIDTCNQLIVTNFFNNSNSDSEAADYIKCLEGLDCNALDTVYTSQIQTVPQACQSQYLSFAGKGGNAGSSNPPSDQCADDDIACWCKKSPNLPACQGSSNPPSDQCNDNDVECICKKNPNLPACQGSSNPPSDQCADNDAECICKKNPGLPACQGSSNPPGDQCADDDVECICKKSPNLPACQGSNPPSDEVITCTSEICKCFEDECNPKWITDNSCTCQGSNPPSDQCSDDDVECICKKNPNLPACQGSSNPPSDQCSDDDVECICKKNPNLPACQGSSNPPGTQCSADDLPCQCREENKSKAKQQPACKKIYDMCEAERVKCNKTTDYYNMLACQCANGWFDYWTTDSGEDAYKVYCENTAGDGRFNDYIYTWVNLLPKFCADRTGENARCGAQYPSIDYCKRLFKLTPSGTCDNRCTTCFTSLRKYIECMNQDNCGVGTCNSLEEEYQKYHADLYYCGEKYQQYCTNS